MVISFNRRPMDLTSLQRKDLSILLSLNEITEGLESCYGELLFVVNGIPCGVTCTVSNYVPSYEAWFGNESRKYSKVSDIINDPFYNGKSIAELVGEIEFEQF